MKTNTDNFELPGFSCDLRDAWNKLRNGQFGGTPGRGAGELMQNAIDGYDSSIAMDLRQIDITSSEYQFSITDRGSGFTLKKLQLLLTFGGTDKDRDPNKMGQFGIGFYSMFHDKLFTKKIEIVTKAEGATVRMTFTVINPDNLPVVKIEVTDEMIDFSTRITVTFGNNTSAGKCLSYARESVINFPCIFRINGMRMDTLWEKARASNWQIFRNNDCHGFLKPGRYAFGNYYTVYCKYEYILRLPVVALAKCGKTPKFDLSDYNEFPYIPEVDVVVNCNTLLLTISRDGYYLDGAYFAMRDLIREKLFERLSAFNFQSNVQEALANLYIFRNDVRNFLFNGTLSSSCSDAHKQVIKALAEARIFRLSGEQKLYSISGLKSMLSENTPLFYSPNQGNLYYLGRKFKHDFILIPDRCHVEGGADNFYKTLLEAIFQDTVNLETLQENNDLLQKLVERGIIPREALTPSVAFVGEKKLKTEEFEFLADITVLLKNNEVLAAIEKNLFLEVTSVKPVFFEVKEEGAFISTGFFDETNQPLTDAFISNFDRNNNSESPLLASPNLVLGLRKDHPLMEELIRSSDPQRAYYALTYIAHELTASQKLLVPFSRFYHLKKESLARDIRNALISALLRDAA